MLCKSDKPSIIIIIIIIFPLLLFLFSPGLWPWEVWEVFLNSFWWWWWVNLPACYMFLPPLPHTSTHVHHTHHLCPPSPPELCIYVPCPDLHGHHSKAVLGCSSSSRPPRNINTLRLYRTWVQGRVGLLAIICYWLKSQRTRPERGCVPQPQPNPASARSGPHHHCPCWKERHGREASSPWPLLPCPRSWLWPGTTWVLLYGMSVYRYIIIIYKASHSEGCFAFCVRCWGPRFWVLRVRRRLEACSSEWVAFYYYYYYYSEGMPPTGFLLF